MRRASRWTKRHAAGQATSMMARAMSAPAPGQQTGKAAHGKGIGIGGIVRKDLVQDTERDIEIIHDHMGKGQPHKGRRKSRPERQDRLKNGPCLPDEPFLAGQIGQIQQAGHLSFGNHISLPC